MVIYFLQFHSKVNRIVKSYPDLEGYSSFVIQEIGPLDATNFKYNDGISTSGTYNFYTDKMPDYAILVDSEGIVRSRWYVSETRWKREGQWEITFRRDALADFYNEITNSTVLIEKATVSDNDPAIYNQEPLTFNQIKKDEKLLKDETGSAWLVGYLSSDNSANKKYDASSFLQIRRTVNGIANWDYYKYTYRTFYGPAQNLAFQARIAGYNSNEGHWLCQYAFNGSGAAVTDTAVPALGYKQLSPGDYAFSENAKDVVEAKKKTSISKYTWSMSEIFSALMPALENYPDMETKLEEQLGVDFGSAEDVSTIKGLDGSKIYDSLTSKTYIVHVNESFGSIQKYTISNVSSLGKYLIDALKSSGRIEGVAYYGFYSIDSEALYAKYSVNSYQITLEEVAGGSVSVTIPAGRRILNDAPYTMFAMPFDGIKFTVGGSTYDSDPVSTLSIARQISLELMSSGALYDLQLLPYCPRRDMIAADGKISMVGHTENEDYTLLTDENEQSVGFMLFAKESSFEFDVQEEIVITNKKVQNQCDMWRLCSPNYNGVFEFNAAKNNGVDYFNIDCTYRPYNPYIHVNPNFKDLYGNDFDDARGLICSGDFSMPACTEKWLEYEAQNKNYQSSFDRSIQHIEIEQKYQRISQIAGMVAGVGAGAAGGAMMGKGYGAIAGAVVGGALSAAGGVADLYMADKLREETLKYARDQFAFSLENIRAIPNSLAKISAFNKNNKIFPFLEYYTCTDIEKEAFKNFLIYDGMTVNRIGKIVDFLQDGQLQFIRAKLIRALDLHDDQHIVDFIASEMEKGAYYDTRSD